MKKNVLMRLLKIFAKSFVIIFFSEILPLLNIFVINCLWFHNLFLITKIENKKSHLLVSPKCQIASPACRLVSHPLSLQPLSYIVCLLTQATWQHWRVQSSSIPWHQAAEGVVVAIRLQKESALSWTCWQTLFHRSSTLLKKQ